MTRTKTQPRRRSMRQSVSQAARRSRAWWAASRLVEMALADAAHDDAGAPTPETLAHENVDPRVQAELRRQLDDLTALRDGRRLAGGQAPP